MTFLSERQKKDLTELFGEKVRFDLPLADWTHIKIGGPADAVVWVEDAEAVAKALHFAREERLPHFTLGKGSNTLVRDAGVRGLVLHFGQGFRKFGVARENGERVWVLAEGGVPTPQLVRWCVDQGYTGIERLAGIPGTVGGNVVMNAGTHLGETADILASVRFLDPKGKVCEWPREKIKFEYRKSSLPPAGVVLEALFCFQKGDKNALAKKVKSLFEKRGLSQPVEKPNLGSVFKNPGKKKAWEYVEEAGLKGVRVGGARVSEKHGNFIVNEGSANAQDVLILINMIREKVKQMFGVSLETEIRVVGEE